MRLAAKERASKGNNKKGEYLKGSTLGKNEDDRRTTLLSAANKNRTELRTRNG
jgi:hypothetical protein